MKECKIIGYGKFKDKDTQEEMLRIVIGIDSTNENYKGTMITTAFLPYDKDLEDDLDYAIKNNKKASYETTDNIITGKTKVSKITVNRNMF